MNTKFLIQASIIGAVYAALTMALAPLSYGVMQIRVAEALTILPFFTPAAIPGLFVGCLIANLLSPFGPLDVVCGSTASLIAAIVSYKLRGKPVLVPLPPVIANAFILGPMLHYGYGVPISLPLCIMWVGLGQLIACYGLGYPLLKYLSKYKGIFE